MFSNKAFTIALLLSIITHGVILFQNQGFNLSPLHKKQQDLEVVFVKTPQETRIDAKNQLPKRESFLKFEAKISSGKRVPPPFVNKEDIFKANKAFSKPAFIKPEVIAIKKRITLPPIDMSKINDPSYISYYQIVREKIKRAAYQNYTPNETGEVYLTFAISNDGVLREVRVVEEKSSSLKYLKEIAIRSVEDATPFPNFPEELKHSHLSFNVIISFEIE